MLGYGLDRAGSGYGHVVGVCECANEPSCSIKCGEFLDYLKPVSFSRRTVLHEVSKVWGSPEICPGFFRYTVCTWGITRAET
jgi:hypothetical protein